MGFKHWRVWLVLILPVLVGFGPCTSGPRFLQIIPGGVLNGTKVDAPMTSWASVPEQGVCALETRPAFPHSLTVFCFRNDDKLYVGCRACADKVWSGYVAQDNRARIRIEDKIYPVSMNRIEGDSLVSTWAEVRGSAEGVPEMPAGLWLYELTSRGSSSDNAERSGAHL